MVMGANDLGCDGYPHYLCYDGRGSGMDDGNDGIYNDDDHRNGNNNSCLLLVKFPHPTSAGVDDIGGFFRTSWCQHHWSWVHGISLRLVKEKGKGKQNREGKERALMMGMNQETYGNWETENPKHRMERESQGE